MLAVGNRAFPRVIAEELARAGNGRLEFGFLNPALVREDERHKTGQTRRIHGAIGRDRRVQLAVGSRSEKAVSPCPKHPLPTSEAGGEGANRWQDRLVPGGEVVFAKKGIGISEAPRLLAVVGILFPHFFRFRRAGGHRLSALADEFLGFRLPRRQQGQLVDRKAVVLVDVFRDERETLIENLLRFRAIVRRGVAVSSHHLELDFNVLGLPLSPDHQWQDATRRLRLRPPDGQAECPAGVFLKALAEHPENHVTHLQYPIRRRSLFHHGDENLPTRFGHRSLDRHPAQRPGRSEVVAVAGVRRRGFGQIDGLRRFLCEESQYGAKQDARHEAGQMKNRWCFHEIGFRKVPLPAPPKTGRMGWTAEGEDLRNRSIKRPRNHGVICLADF